MRNIEGWTLYLNGDVAEAIREHLNAHKLDDSAWFEVLATEELARFQVRKGRERDRDEQTKRLEKVFYAVITDYEASREEFRNPYAPYQKGQVLAFNEGEQTDFLEDSGLITEYYDSHEDAYRRSRQLS